MPRAALAACSGCQGKERDPGISCGTGWAEDHHDIAITGPDGTLLARRRISDDAADLAALLDLLASCGDTPEDPIAVAIETPRGLLTACLRATGRLLGHCLATGQHYDETIAFPRRHSQPATSPLHN